MDARHSDIALVSLTPAKRRQFAEWAMAHIGKESQTASFETDITRGAFNPSKFDGNSLIEHLALLLEEELAFAECKSTAA